MNEHLGFSLFFQTDRHSIEYLTELTFYSIRTCHLTSPTRKTTPIQTSKETIEFSLCQQVENVISFQLLLRQSHRILSVVGTKPLETEWHFTSRLSSKVKWILFIRRVTSFGEVQKSLYSLNLEFSFIKSALTQPIILQNVRLWRWARYFSSDLNLLSFSVNFFNLTGFHRTHFLAVWRWFLCWCLSWFIKGALTNASNETLSLENVLLFSWSIFVKVRMWNIWDDTILNGICWVILLFFCESSSMFIYFIIGVKILQTGATNSALHTHTFVWTIKPLDVCVSPFAWKGNGDRWTWRVCRAWQVDSGGRRGGVWGGYGLCSAAKTNKPQSTDSSVQRSQNRTDLQIEVSLFLLPTSSLSLTLS